MNFFKKKVIKINFLLKIFFQNSKSVAEYLGNGDILVSVVSQMIPQLV